ncbi:MAG: four helix bundle protein [Acidobacteriaceae bacterium]
MKNFRDMVVWQRSHQLTLGVYKATQKFPREELYGLISHLRRSSSSVPCNIAEGCGRRGNGEFHKFLQIAMGSASEVEYQLLLSYELGYVAETEYRDLSKDIVEVKKMLAGLIKRVEEARVASNY